MISVQSIPMEQGQTTVSVQRFLDDLACSERDLPSGEIVRNLLARTVDRLHMICSRLLYKEYPRLTRGPLNMQPEELLGAVVERMIKAMRVVHPQTVRQFFALAHQHMRWELNDLARRLDERAATVGLSELAAQPPADPTTTSASIEMRRILGAIESLPEDEREVFQLVRLQGMTKPEAAEVIGVSAKTVQRRLNRSLLMLSKTLGDLGPPALS
jgi:RNA polymerase sigma factor (sigma-70 family)